MNSDSKHDSNTMYLVSSSGDILYKCRYSFYLSTRKHPLTLEYLVGMVMAFQ